VLLAISDGFLVSLVASCNFVDASGFLTEASTVLEAVGVNLGALALLTIVGAVFALN
jgi:hypothetical protein